MSFLSLDLTIPSDEKSRSQAAPWGTIEKTFSAKRRKRGAFPVKSDQNNREGFKVGTLNGGSLFL